MLDGASSSLIQIVPFVLILGDLLFHYSAADPAEAAEGAGVPGEPEGERQSHHDGRNLGQIAKINGDRVSLQVADKVRIEVSRAAIGGLQGQPPVVESQQS